MDYLELEMLLDFFDRVGFGKGLAVCVLLVVLGAVRAHWRKRRHKRIYREFQRELVLCRQRLESIQKSIEARPRDAARTPPFLPKCLVPFWRILTGPRP